MSQAFKPLTSSGPIPPIIPTSFETDDGTAIPSANILEVFAYDSEENNLNGITTKGGNAAGNPPGTADSNEVGIYLTNRITGTAQTTDNSTDVNLILFNLNTAQGGATPGTYLFSIRIVTYDVTKSLGAASDFNICIRTTGAAPTVLNTGNQFITEEGALEDSRVEYGTSGNNLRVSVRGIDSDVINWSAVVEYIFIGS